MQRCWNRRAAALAVALVTTAAPPARADDPAPIDLAQVAGADQFPGGPRERDLLARNGFVVLPRLHRQIFSPYIGGPLPPYVTCDSAHHTYQVLFETALMEVERALARRLRTAVELLHGRLASATPSTPRLREGHELALGYVTVARRLISEPTTPTPAAAGPAAAEVGLVESAAGIADSPLFRVREDYADYQPRGRYAGDAGHERYFRTVKWLGRMGFRVVDERATAAAVVLVRAVAQDGEARAALESIDALLATLVGPADDLTLGEYATTVRATVAGAWSDAALEAGLDDIRRALGALRDPEINASLLPPDAWRAFRERTKGLRILPARWTPDAWLFQALDESSPPHAQRTGLEVALAFGSRAAETALAARGEASDGAVARVRAKAESLHRRPSGAHYGATLDLVRQMGDEQSPLLGAGAAPEGDLGTPILPAPLFRTGAWRARLLTTGLATWTSLRHAWTLHAKTSWYALGLARDSAGVVEPAPRFFAGLAELARAFTRAADGVTASSTDPRAVLGPILPPLRKLAHGDRPTAAEIDALRAVSAAFEELPRARVRPASELQVLVDHLEAWLAGKGELDATERAFVAGLSRSPTAGYLVRFATLMDALREIAERELAGKALDDAQTALVEKYGKTIAELNFFDGSSWLRPDRQMGCVVDVTSDPRRPSRLLEAVGPAMEIYVVLPLRGGGHQLYQGGVYAQYEFESAAPMTDDAWRARIAQRRLPPLAPWTSSYVAPLDVEAIVAEVEKGERPEEVESVHDERIGRALVARLRTTVAKEHGGERLVAWLAEHVSPYADGTLHADVVGALLHVLLASDLEAEFVDPGVVVARRGRSTWPLNTAARELARAADRDDRARLVQAVVTPPMGASEHARGWVAIALGQLSPRLTTDEARPLLDAADPQVRGCGVDALVLALERDETAPVASAVEAGVALLPTERDERVVRTVLHGLERIAPRVDRRHAARVAPYLDAADPSTRAVAATVAGALHDVDAATRLRALLDDPIPEVAAAAARALGAALAGTSDDRARQAIAALEQRLASPTSPERADRRLRRASLEGIGLVGGELGAGGLERVATNPAVDMRDRRSAIDELRQLGTPAVPALHRLAFLEESTGDGVSGRALRLCDEAVATLDGLVDGALGWGRSWPDEERTKAILERVRKEAREKGYLK